MGGILDELLAHAQVIHQSGDHPATGDRLWLAERAAGLPAAIRLRYALAPYVGAELRHVYAAADLVIGRSGAGTVNECCHLGRPAIYIRCPGPAEMSRPSMPAWWRRRAAPSCSLRRR